MVGNAVADVTTATTVAAVLAVEPSTATGSADVAALLAVTLSNFLNNLKKKA